MKPHEQLNEAMNSRRLDLGLTWKRLAAVAGISAESLGAIRRGIYKPKELTARGLDDALQWEHGTTLGFYPDDEHPRGAARPKEQARHDDEIDIDLDTFVPESPAEKAMLAIYHARQQEERAIRVRLEELNKKLEEQDKKIEQLRADRSQNGSDEPRRSA